MPGLVLRDWEPKLSGPLLQCLDQSVSDAINVTHPVHLDEHATVGVEPRQRFGLL